ncbi:hypothetical protein ACFPER_13890 [Agromyces aurantiacus]|uniref:Uncharacterized protein n=1 Tax=Agromyces aurantiacus TaxID=165814 RepID=A0ABV9RC34_9MICO|nr:hypothetical protein [Agromyces aurantiacus]MBM7505215.1 hypothetical protein [Agromyces aurantiacus]
MTARIGVVATAPGFRVAVAGLPFRAEEASAPERAVVVVDGRGEWWDAAARAAAGGAGAVLVADPGRAPVDAIDALAAGVDVPLLLHRPRLRHDLVARALEARGTALARVIVAECRAEPGGLPALVRDAVGWIRLLAGGPMELVATGGAALLRPTAGRAPVGTLVATATTTGGPVLRVRALGETTTELEIDDPIGRRELSTSTAAGRTVAPALHESAERAALRRALDAAESGDPADDLSRLRHDSGIADRVASARLPEAFS